MAKLILSVVCSVALLSPLPAGDPGLRLVSTVWPPFTDLAERPRLAADLVHEALRRAGVDAETDIVADGLLVPSMRDGSHAGSGALWYSEERASFLLYSEPYMENRLVLVGRTGADVGAASLRELAGTSVALVTGYAYGPELEGLRALGDESRPRFVLGESIEHNLQALLDGEVDYLVLDQLVIRYIVDQYRESALAHLEIGTTPLVSRPLHFAIRRDHPGAAAIVAAFNGQIEAMLADGTYNRILGLAWIDADVDGDGRSELLLEGVHAGVMPPIDAYRVLPPEPAPEEPVPTTTTGKLRMMIGGTLYEDWREVPDHYKTAPPPPSATENRSAVPLFTIRF